MTKKELEESREKIFRAYQTQQAMIVAYESMIKEISLYAEDNMDKTDKAAMTGILQRLQLRLRLAARG